PGAHQRTVLYLPTHRAAEPGDITKGAMKARIACSPGFPTAQTVQQTPACNASCAAVAAKHYCLLKPMPVSPTATTAMSAPYCLTGTQDRMPHKSIPIFYPAR